MGGRQVLAARRLLAGALDGELPEHRLVAAARAVVTELGSPERLLELVAELASGEGIRTPTPGCRTGMSSASTSCC